MFALRGLAARPALRFAQSPSAVLMPARRQATTSTAAKVDFFEKNAKLGRPMSPHLTIYKPQITSVLSISHRITGVAWHFALGVPAIGLVATGTPWSDAMATIQSANISPELIQSAKFFVTFPFVYHTFNGVRHLVWDRAVGLTIKGLYESGYLVLGASFVTTLGLLVAR